MSGYIPPDIEAALVSYLAGLGKDWHVCTRYPTGEPEPNVVVQVSATGGNTKSSFAVGSTVLVEVWAADNVSAVDAAHSVYGALTAMPNGVYAGESVYRVIPGLPIDYPDPVRPERHRRQFVATVSSKMRSRA